MTRHHRQNCFNASCIPERGIADDCLAHSNRGSWHHGQSSRTPSDRARVCRHPVLAGRVFIRESLPEAIVGWRLPMTHFHPYCFRMSPAACTTFSNAFSKSVVVTIPTTRPSSMTGSPPILCCNISFAADSAVSP